MTGPEVDRLRALYSRWAEGDFAADPGIFADDVILEPWSFEPRASYRGAEEIGAWLRTHLSAWSKFLIEATELVEGERGIVVTERQAGTLAGGDDSQMRMYAVWEFEEGLVERVRWETDRGTAYASAAVQQQSADWSRTYSATAGLPFDDVDLESRILWIWGSPRTGSTWLLRQICHPAVLDRGHQLGFTLPAGSEELRAVPYNEFLISSHAAPKWGPPMRIGDSYAPTTLPGFAGDHSGYAFAERYVDIWAKELRRLVLVRLAAVLDRARVAEVPLAPSPLLPIKEVNGSHAVMMVMKLFPRSRMLFLIRDGRDVVDSLLHAYSPGGWMQSDGDLEAAAERIDWVRNAATEWSCNTDIVRSAFNQHSPELRYEVRYEDLLADTPSSLGALLEWLDLPADPDRVAEIVAANSFERIPEKQRGATRVTRAAKPGLWRENLTEEERAAVSEIMGHRIAALGYEPE